MDDKTYFTEIYNCFLGKISDDMYMELTPAETIKDLQNLLVSSLPEFEFPRINVYDFKLCTLIKKKKELKDTDFIIEELPLNPQDPSGSPDCKIEHSYFRMVLTAEEINILALLMEQEWIRRQLATVELIRMKYSSADFKLTSQATHLQKLLLLQDEIRRQSFHMQRLYKRRAFNEKEGKYVSNWSSLNERSALK